MAITTFKLLIHMIADYSLYWVLMTIRCHGKYQSDLMPGIPHSGAHVSGSGFAARLFGSIIGILDIPLSFPPPSPISCLPDPYPPDLRRYTQIGVLIFLLWFFALFEPYGLRLRHLIMGHYRPERAKARATWLYNHILRTRGSFMKFARRKLHREYKYSSEASLTFRQWLTDIVPFQCLRSLVGLGPRQQNCLLCGITSSSDPDSRLTKCQTPGCPGVFCISCFADIGEMCTLCLSPADYGDLSDVSLEKGSSDDSDSDGGLNQGRMNPNITLHSTTEINRTSKPTRSKDENRRWNFFKETNGPRSLQDSVVLVYNYAYKNKRSFLSNLLLKRFQNLKRNIKRKRAKKDTDDWVAKVKPKKTISKNGNHVIEYSDLVSNRTQSIGVNTDRNRGILGMLSKSFFRRKEKQSRSKRKKAKRDLKHKKPPMRRIKERTHSAESCQKTKFSTTFQSLNFSIRTRNLKCVVRNKKDNRTRNRMKGYEGLKGITRAIRCFLNGNDINKLTNQNNDNAPVNSPNEDRKKITKASDNANFSGMKNKKECSKDNKPKKTRKQKDINKIKTKNSRHRIAEFHKFFSNHWNNFKSSIMPDNAQNRSDVLMPKEKKNHKRRKKRKSVGSKETDIEKCFARRDIKQTRNLRISAFLAELEWTKRDFRKEKDIEEEKDSFLQTLEPPVPMNTNKIVGMVQLRSLPFQWREAPKTCMCGKNCACPRKQSCTRLFVTLSKKKLTAKRAIDRFRHKVNTMMEAPVSSSMIPRVSTSITNRTRGESPIICESSICLSKRTSLYRSFNPGWSQHSDLLNTDLLFENTKYGSKLMQDPFGDIPSNLSERSSNLSSLLGKDIVVSRNSITKEEEGPKRRCRCDVLDDLQRKWDHVKKSFTDIPGTRNPLSMLKNFCSSLFGPTCDMETCPVIRGKRDGQPKKQTRDKEQSNREPRRIESRTNILVTVGIQTQDQQFMETQKTDQHVMETITSDIVRIQDEEETGVMAHKVIQSANKAEMATGPCEDCSQYFHREVQYDPEDARDLITNDKKFTENKAVGSYLCLCDQSVQFTPCELCTCATQHVSRSKFDNIWQRQVNSMTVEGTPPVYPSINKKTQHKVVAEVAHKATHCTTRKQFKNSKDVKPGLSSAVTSQKPSLDKIQLNRLIKVVQPVKEQLTDTISDSSSSSVSLKSDGSKTDTTICSLATMNYNDIPRRKRLKVKVITKANQATLTDKTKVCDTGMVTDDWWSPIVERKANDAIQLEKKAGFNVMEKQKKELQELKGLKELREVRKRRNCGVATNFRNVTFRSTTQIIPTALVPCKNILSPSRYLLESQKYYNELFACDYRHRPQTAYNYVSHMPKFYEKEWNKSHKGSRRNHHHKTKRLGECYSPRRQISPRKRKTELVKTPESPHRKHRQDRQSNNRHAKNHSPRKRM